MNPEDSSAYLSSNHAHSHYGVTRYAEVAARFHAALLSSELGHQERANPVYATQRAFDHADAFFAELTKRTSL